MMESSRLKNDFKKMEGSIIKDAGNTFRLKKK